MSTHPRLTGQRPAGAWLGFIAAVIALFVVAVGIPVGLVGRVSVGLGSSQSLPGVGAWDEIRSWVTTQRSSTELARIALRIPISLCWLLRAGLSSHGGLGGPPDPAVPPLPAELKEPVEPIFTSPAIHRVLKGWLIDIDHPTDVTAGVAPRGNDRHSAAATPP